VYTRIAAGLAIKLITGGIASAVEVVDRVGALQAVFRVFII